MPNKNASFIQYGVGFIGLIYTVLGVLGFLPLDFLNPMHLEGVGVRYLLNLVAINPLHNLVHLAIGLTGLWAAQTLTGAQRWGKIFGLTLLLLFALGMVQAVLEGFPKDQLLLDLVPLNSPGHMLHLMSGGLALYLGLARPPAASPGVSNSDV